MFVHERHGSDSTLPRFAGWWGHDKKTRFQMGSRFDALPGAEGWQLSNPPILQLAALRASMELFDAATVRSLRTKGDRLTAYLEWLLRSVPSDRLSIVTPTERGSMLTLRVNGAPELVDYLGHRGAVADLRPPDIVRVTPVPLYSTYQDVYRLAQLISRWSRGES
jgi:kynureninase